MTKPTLYHHYGSKQGVLETLLHEQVDPFIENLRQAADYQGDLPATLGEIVTTVFTFGQEQPDLYWMLAAANLTASDSPASQLLAERVVTQVGILTDLFDAAVIDHGNIRGKQRLAAETLLAMIAIHLRLAGRGELTLDDRAAWFLIQQFSYGIYT